MIKYSPFEFFGALPWFYQGLPLECRPRTMLVLSQYLMRLSDTPPCPLIYFHVLHEPVKNQMRLKVLDARTELSKSDLVLHFGWGWGQRGGVWPLPRLFDPQNTCPEHTMGSRQTSRHTCVNRSMLPCGTSLRSDKRQTRRGRTSRTRIVPPTKRQWKTDCEYLWQPLILSRMRIDLVPGSQPDF